MPRHAALTEALLLGSLLGFAAAAVAPASVGDACEEAEDAAMLQKARVRHHAVAGATQLRFSKDGAFKVALFCDMHFGENETDDNMSMKFQRTIIGLESPDLIIVDGDAYSDYAAPVECKEKGDSQVCQDFARAQWEKWSSAMEETKTPYAWTLGNHDRIQAGAEIPIPNDGMQANYGVTPHLVIQMDTQNSQSLTQDGPEQLAGASNYVLPVLGPDGKTAFYIWMMDSSDYNCLSVQGYGCVYPNQVAWYREMSEKLEKENGRKVPGFAFIHIPLREVLWAWNWPDVATNGTKGEDICPFSVNTGLFAAMAEQGNIWAVLSGHDHNNDFVSLYRGILIGYGRKSGWGGYRGGVVDRPGSRVLEVRLPSGGGPPKFETYVREESGTKDYLQPVKAEDREMQAAGCSEEVQLKNFTAWTPMDDQSSGEKPEGDTSLSAMAGPQIDLPTFAEQLRLGGSRQTEEYRYVRDLCRRFQHRAACRAVVAMEPFA